MKDWFFIAKRAPVLGMVALQSLWRTATPNFLVALSVIVAFAMGDLNVNHWLMLVPMVTASFGVGLAQDRAEARAAKWWAVKFWSIIESDHMVEISVTHKNSPEARAS